MLRNEAQRRERLLVRIAVFSALTAGVSAAAALIGEAAVLLR